MTTTFPSPSRALVRLVLAAGALAALAGCQSLSSDSGVVGFLTPYKMEIVQGNVITSEQVAMARPGLTRAQVRDVMGSPLLADPFHADRWDYVFTIRRQGAEPQLRRIVVLFKNDALVSVDGAADLPSEREFVASIDPDKAPRNPPVLALTEEQLKALPVPPRAPAPEPVPPAPARSYPPLEEPSS